MQRQSATRWSNISIKPQTTRSVKGDKNISRGQLTDELNRVAPTEIAIAVVLSRDRFIAVVVTTTAAGIGQSNDQTQALFATLLSAYSTHSRATSAPAFVLCHYAIWVSCYAIKKDSFADESTLLPLPVNESICHGSYKVETFKDTCNVQSYVTSRAGY